MNSTGHILFYGQLLIHPHQLRVALTLGHRSHGESISLHHSPVILLVGLAQFRGHGSFIIKVRKAHQQNDRAVMQAYGFPVGPMTESQCVAELMRMYKNARANGFGVLICAAGMAAHLAGAFAGNSTLPVIGIPMKGGAMDGLDALLATVQMPSGIPVATVAINGAKNAAVLAAQISTPKPFFLARLANSAAAAGVRWALKMWAS